MQDTIEVRKMPELHELETKLAELNDKQCKGALELMMEMNNKPDRKSLHVMIPYKGMLYGIEIPHDRRAFWDLNTAVIGAMGVNLLDDI